MTTTSSAVNRLAAAIETSGLIAPGDRVLAAVSGGADSMALLHALLGLPLHVTVAHFEHGIRDDARRDRELVESFCASNGVACHCGEGSAPGRATAHRESLEEAARNLRYEFLEATADRVGAHAIATAHTLDDHIETVLMRIMVGSGIRGLSGIPRRRGRIVRPFLGVRREDIESYCAVHRVPFVVDATNADTRYARNHVRHRVLPALRASLPDADRRVLEVARRAQARLTALRRVTAPVVERHLARESSNVWLLPLDPVSHLGDAHLTVLLSDIVTDELRGDAARCHYEALVRLVRRPDGAGAGVSLPGMTVRREHDGLVFTRRSGSRSADVRAHEATLALPGSTMHSGIEVRLDVAAAGRYRDDLRARGETGGDGTATVAYFARESIRPPLRVRRWNRGDRMTPFGMAGSKKLSDIFIDKKIPHRRRGDAWVIEDQSGIVWLVGVTTRESTRVTAATTSIVRATVSFSVEPPAREQA